MRSGLEVSESIRTLFQESREATFGIPSGWWKPIGKPEDTLEATMLILADLSPDILRNVELHDSFQGEVSLSRGSIARKKGVAIGGPAIVGQDTTIRASDCTGPYPSIGNKSVIEKREVENSIVKDWLIMAIEDGIIGSLLGPRSTLSSNWDVKHKGKKFVLGEGSMGNLWG